MSNSTGEHEHYAQFSWPQHVCASCVHSGEPLPLLTDTSQTAARQVEGRWSDDAAPWIVEVCRPGAEVETTDKSLLPLRKDVVRAWERRNMDMVVGSFPTYRRGDCACGLP